MSDVLSADEGAEMLRGLILLSESQPLTPRDRQVALSALAALARSHEQLRGERDGLQLALDCEKHAHEMNNLVLLGKLAAADQAVEALRETDDVLAAIGNWIAGISEPHDAVLSTIDERIGKNAVALAAVDGTAGQG